MIILSFCFQISGGIGQVLNLGAGFDTLYWRLKKSGRAPSNFVEIDFPSIAARKCKLIQKYQPLVDTLNPTGGVIRICGTDLHAADYHLVGADLRHVEELERKLVQVVVDTSLPTLLLAECVLVYMDSEASENLLRYFARTFRNSLFISYEQINMKDKFGEVMLDNLRRRGCSLLGVDRCESLDTQRKR
ncbi:hypothetical protein QAD02_002841, partial [Eretmocerus hayati]